MPIPTNFYVKTVDITGPDSVNVTFAEVTDNGEVGGYLGGASNSFVLPMTAEEASQYPSGSYWTRSLKKASAPTPTPPPAT